MWLTGRVAQASLSAVDQSKSVSSSPGGVGDTMPVRSRLDPSSDATTPCPGHQVETERRGDAPPTRSDSTTSRHPRSRNPGSAAAAASWSAS
jgi:hypothetical protein